MTPLEVVLFKLLFFYGIGQLGLWVFTVHLAHRLKKLEEKDGSRRPPLR